MALILKKLMHLQTTAKVKVLRRILLPQGYHQFLGYPVLMWKNTKKSDTEVCICFVERLNLILNS